MSTPGKGGSWVASLPQQPLPISKGKGTSLDRKPTRKRPPTVVRVQQDFVRHLQNAYPILDPSIVQLIVEDQGEDNIEEAVKALSSLAADAEKEEKEAASARAFQASLTSILKDKESSASNCMDDKVAMETAIAASLADQEVQHSVGRASAGHRTVGQDDGSWEADGGWESIDPAVAAEWGLLAGQSDVTDPVALNPIIVEAGGRVNLHLPTAEVTDVSGVSSEAAMVLAAGWGMEVADVQERPSAKPLDFGAGAANGPGVQAMAAILGENWATEPLWELAPKLGDMSAEKRDPAVEWPGAPDVKGKAKVRPYTPKLAEAAGKRPYSPRILAKSEIDNGATQQSKQEKLADCKTNVGWLEKTNGLSPEDDEAEVLKQLKAMFPSVEDSVICRAYIDADTDANKAAEALCQSGGWFSEQVLSQDVPESAASGLLQNSISAEEFSTRVDGNEVPSSPKEEASFQGGLWHAATNAVVRSGSHIIPSQQHPKPFSEDESDHEHIKSQRQLVSPANARSSSGSGSTQNSPVTSPKTRRKGKRKGRQVTSSGSSSSSGEEAKKDRRDMVDFAVEMLGGSVPAAVVADVIENLKGDFQQSLKCLFSMSAECEGGIIGEDFGTLTDGSDGAGSLLASLSRPSSDEDDEDPVATLVDIFGQDKKETIEQVLKEKGRNVKDAATVLMAMHESETGAGSSDDYTAAHQPEEQPAQEDMVEEDPGVKINVEQLMAHFPLADRSVVQNLLQISDNSFEDAARMLYDSGLNPRGLDVSSLSARPTLVDTRFGGIHTEEQSLQTRSVDSDFRFRPVTPSYGSRGRPPGRFEQPGRHPQAHLQPLFGAEEFPEIGAEVIPQMEMAVPIGRAPELTGHNAFFLKNRYATNKHWRAYQYYFSEAARARANREFSRAEALKEQGRKHKRLAEAANQVASSKIFTEKNKTIRNTIKIDVHGQLVQEALKHVDDHLKSLSNLTTISHLSIITGRGLHSENGKAKILPAVQKYLKERGYSFYQENPGCITVDLKAERQVPSSLSSAEDADDRPSSADSFEERPGRLEGLGNGQAAFRKLSVS